MIPFRAPGSVPGSWRYTAVRSLGGEDGADPAYINSNNSSRGRPWEPSGLPSSLVPERNFAGVPRRASENSLHDDMDRLPAGCSLASSPPSADMRSFSSGMQSRWNRRENPSTAIERSGGFPAHASRLWGGGSGNSAAATSGRAMNTVNIINNSNNNNGGGGTGEVIVIEDSSDEEENNLQQQRPGLRPPGQAASACEAGPRWRHQLGQDRHPLRQHLDHPKVPFRAPGGYHDAGYETGDPAVTPRQRFSSDIPWPAAPANAWGDDRSRQRLARGSPRAPLDIHRPPPRRIESPERSPRIGMPGPGFAYRPPDGAYRGRGPQFLPERAPPPAAEPLPPGRGWTSRYAEMRETWRQQAGESAFRDYDDDNDNNDPLHPSPYYSDHKGRWSPASPPHPTPAGRGYRQDGAWSARGPSAFSPLAEPGSPRHHREVNMPLGTAPASSWFAPPRRHEEPSPSRRAPPLTRRPASSSPSQWRDDDAVFPPWHGAALDDRGNRPHPHASPPPMPPRAWAQQPSPQGPPVWPHRASVRHWRPAPRQLSPDDERPLDHDERPGVVLHHEEEPLMAPRPGPPGVEEPWQRSPSPPPPSPFRSSSLRVLEPPQPATAVGGAPPRSRAMALAVAPRRVAPAGSLRKRPASRKQETPVRVVRPRPSALPAHPPAAIGSSPQGAPEERGTASAEALDDSGAPIPDTLPRRMKRKGEHPKRAAPAKQLRGKRKQQGPGPSKGNNKAPQKPRQALCMCMKGKAIYGLLGDSRENARWCGACPSRPPHAVDVFRKRCECGISQPSFGLPGTGLKDAQWCSLCPRKPKNAINVRSKRCECGRSQPSFGPATGGKLGMARWCKLCPNKPANAPNFRIKSKFEIHQKRRISHLPRTASPRSQAPPQQPVLRFPEHLKRERQLPVLRSGWGMETVERRLRQAPPPLPVARAPDPEDWEGSWAPPLAVLRAEQERALSKQQQEADEDHLIL